MLAFDACTCKASFTGREETRNRTINSYILIYMNNIIYNANFGFSSARDLPDHALARPSRSSQLPLHLLLQSAASSRRMAATTELLGWLGRSMLRAALKLCCLPDETIDGIERRHMQRDAGGAHLICYLDGVSEELVRRQLEFRRTRKLERSASRTSLSSLDMVSEDSLLQSGGLLHSGGLLGTEALRRNLSTPAMGSLHGDHAPMFSSKSSDRLHLLVTSSARSRTTREERSRREHDPFL